MTTEERLEKLEAELTKMREGLTVANVIRAKKFELVDEQGESRAELSMSGDNPSLALYASKGDSCARLAVIGDDAVLTLIDKQGTFRVSLGVIGAKSSLALADENEKIIWSAP